MCIVDTGITTRTLVVTLYEARLVIYECIGGFQIKSFLLLLSDF